MTDMSRDERAQPGPAEPDGEYDGVEHWLGPVDVYADTTGAHATIRLRADRLLPERDFTASDARGLARNLLAAADRLDPPHPAQGTSHQGGPDKPAGLRPHIPHSVPTKAEAQLVAWQSAPRSPGPWWTHPDEPLGLWWGDQAALVTNDQDPEECDEEAFGRDYGPVLGGNIDRPEDTEAIVTAVNNYGPVLHRIVELEQAIGVTSPSRPR